LAEYDYFVLGEGIETDGAPDFGIGARLPSEVSWETLLGKLEYLGVQGLQALDLDTSSKGSGEATRRRDCYLVQLGKGALGPIQEGVSEGI
jgi:hypothetical protein